jgi:hypothetical protein
MPITNLNNSHLTAAQVTAAKTALTSLETTLVVLNVNISAEDRQRYGSINEQNKLLVNKTMDYHNNQPELQTPHVDWVEYTNDFSSRSTLDSLITRLESLITRLQNAKMLHDFDNYQGALADYAYTSFMAGTGTVGYEDKMNDLKQFFSRTASANKNTPPAI